MVKHRGLIDEWQTVPDIWNQVKDNLDFKYVVLVELLL